MGEAALAGLGGTTELFASVGLKTGGFVCVGERRMGDEMESLMGDVGFSDWFFDRFFLRKPSEGIEAAEPSGRRAESGEQWRRRGEEREVGRRGGGRNGEREGLRCCRYRGAVVLW
jgi:hypothetical protein